MINRFSIKCFLCLDSTVDYDYNDGGNDFNNVSSLSSRQRTKANRHVEVNEETGIRSFRD
ncbi:unnamed protein product, partial [Rotaria magnacalcarata]